MRRGEGWHKAGYGEWFRRRNFPTSVLYLWVTRSVKLPTCSGFHWGSLLVEEVVRPAAVYICKRKCLENGEWSEGLSYCVGEEVSAGTREEDVGILHPIDKKQLA